VLKVILDTGDYAVYKARGNPVPGARI